MTKLDSLIVLSIFVIWDMARWGTRFVPLRWTERVVSAPVQNPQGKIHFSSLTA